MIKKMDFVWVILLYALCLGVCIEAFHNRAVVFTECCLCDDASADVTKRCSTPDVCSHSFKRCDYCLMAKQYTNNKWMTKRECSFKSTCETNYYHTLYEPGCSSSAVTPASGTMCYSCCKNDNVFTPRRHCIENPDSPDKVIKFNITTTTTTTPSTTPTTPTTTTPMTTTTITTTPTTKTTTSPTTMTSTTKVTTTTNQPGQYCMVGDGTFSLQRCDDTTPMCMNTIVVTQNFTIRKKSCETRLLCDKWSHDTSVRRDCLEKDVSHLQASDPGLVCHYCCNSSRNGTACNEDDIPADVQTYIAQNVVDGGWSNWLPWYGCSPTCSGIQVRVRTCDKPYPNQLGRRCQGKGFEELDCDSSNCKVTGTGALLIG